MDFGIGSTDAGSNNRASADRPVRDTVILSVVCQSSRLGRICLRRPWRIDSWP